MRLLLLVVHFVALPMIWGPLSRSQCHVRELWAILWTFNKWQRLHRTCSPNVKLRDVQWLSCCFINLGQNVIFQQESTVNKCKFVKTRGRVPAGLTPLTLHGSVCSDIGRPQSFQITATKQTWEMILDLLVRLRVCQSLPHHSNLHYCIFLLIQTGGTLFRFMLISFQMGLDAGIGSKKIKQQFEKKKKTAEKRTQIHIVTNPAKKKFFSVFLCNASCPHHRADSLLHLETGIIPAYLKLHVIIITTWFLLNLIADKIHLKCI